MVPTPSTRVNMGWPWWLVNLGPSVRVELSSKSRCTAFVGLGEKPRDRRRQRCRSMPRRHRLMLAYDNHYDDWGHSSYRQIRHNLGYKIISYSPYDAPAIRPKDSQLAVVGSFFCAGEMRTSATAAGRRQGSLTPKAPRSESSPRY